MTSTLPARLTRALVAANLPIAGVSIGDMDDRSTWSVDWLDTPTDEQQKQSSGIIAGLLLSDPDSDASYQASAAFDANEELRAGLIAVFWQLLGKQPTDAQVASLRSKFIDVRKTLK